MSQDIYVFNSVNNYGIVKCTGLNTRTSSKSSVLPEPDVTGLNNIYDVRFFGKNGLEYSMDRLTADEYYSTETITGSIGELATLSFDPDSNEEVIFTSLSSANYEYRPLDILIKWTNLEVDPSGAVVFGAQIKPYIDESEISGAVYNTPISGEFQVGDSGEITESRILMTRESLAGFGKSSNYAVKIIRYGESPEDTFDGNAIVTGLEFIESSNIK